MSHRRMLKAWQMRITRTCLLKAPSCILRCTYISPACYRPSGRASAGGSLSARGGGNSSARGGRGAAGECAITVCHAHPSCCSPNSLTLPSCSACTHSSHFHSLQCCKRTCCQSIEATGVTGKCTFDHAPFLVWSWKCATGADSAALAVRVAELEAELAKVRKALTEAEAALGEAEADIRDEVVSEIQVCMRSCCCEWYCGLDHGGIR